MRMGRKGMGMRMGGKGMGMRTGRKGTGMRMGGEENWDKDMHTHVYCVGQSIHYSDAMPYKTVLMSRKTGQPVVEL